MATKIRLARRGRKARPIYDIVVADSRAPRDGKFIEKLGVFNPNTNPALLTVNEDKALDWVIKGAQPTDTVRDLLSGKGIMLRKHLQLGVAKGAITQEDADKKFEAWKSEKDAKEQASKSSAEQAAEKAAKEAADRRKKLKEEADAKIAAAAAAQVVVEETEESTEEVSSEEAPAEESVEATTEEVVTEEAVEETKKEEPVAEAKVEEAAEEAKEAPQEETKKEE